MNKKGMTLAEVLVCLSVIIILLSLAAPAVSAVQLRLTQRELDDKAEIIYTAVQSRLTQLRALGSSGSYSQEHASGMVNGSNPQSAGIPAGDHTDEQLAEFDDHPLYYAASSDKEDEGSAAYALMKDQTEEELWAGSWIIEYSPDTAFVYAVFYSPADSEGTDACTGYTDVATHSHYDEVIRSQKGRFADLKNKKASVGYYSGQDSGGIAQTGKLAVSMTIDNSEQLKVRINCKKPASDAKLAFKVTLADNEGNSYSRWYLQKGCSTERLDPSVDIDKTTYIYNVGSRYSLDLVLDDISSPQTRFKSLYGSQSGHNKGIASAAKELVPGTALTVTVTAICPEDDAIEPDTCSGTTNSQGILQFDENLIDRFGDYRLVETHAANEESPDGYMSRKDAEQSESCEFTIDARTYAEVVNGTYTGVAGDSWKFDMVDGRATITHTEINWKYRHIETVKEDQDTSAPIADTHFILYKYKGPGVPTEITGLNRANVHDTCECLLNNFIFLSIHAGNKHRLLAALNKPQGNLGYLLRSLARTVNNLRHTAPCFPVKINCHKICIQHTKTLIYNTYLHYIKLI
ncbi:MAG: type II secretion system protein [Firmicutes bacterium]|nr:type II secretion system protein [Bacillota bacterium]